MAVTHKAEATKSLLKENVDPEIKMEVQCSSGLQSGEGRKREDLPDPGKMAPELIHHVKQEPDEGPSRNWDAQLQEFLKTLLAPDSDGESPPLAWNDPRTAQVLSQRTMDASNRPRGAWLAQEQPHVAVEAPQEHESSREMTMSSGKGQKGAVSGAGARLEKQHQHFRQLGYQEAEGPRELCRHLQELCHEWLKPEKHTKDQILDLVTLEQFLAVLPSDMQSWLRESTPRTCAQAVSLAEDFLVRQQEVKGWSKQMMGMPEGKSGQPLRGKQALSEMVKAQLSRQAEEEADGEESSLGKPDRSGHRAEQENRNEKEKRAHQLVGSQRVFQATNDPPFSNTKGKSDAGGLGQNSHHVVCDSTGPEEKCYKCWHCNQTFGCSSDLLIHERTHVDEKLYICSRCGERERIHTGQFSHICTHCGNNFGWIPQGALGTSKEKCFMCPECGKRYSQRSDCLKHQNTHAGGKLNKCSACGESFTTYPSLKVHRKIHRGQNAYKCLHCGKCFMWSSRLSMHERIHQAVCSHCGKSFRQKSELFEHERTHAASK